MSPLPRISPILMFPTAEPTETRQKEWGGTEGPNPPGRVKQIDNKREGLEPPPVRVKQVDKERGGFDPTPSASKQVDDERG